MAIKNNNDFLDAPAVPALPVAPQMYSPTWGASTLNILRLYFNLITNALRQLLGPAGGRYLAFPSASFYDLTDQYDGSTNIPYPFRLSNTSYSNGITVESRDVVATASISTTTMTVTAITSGRFYPSMLLSGTGVTVGTYVYLQLSSTAAAVATPTRVSGGAIGATTFVVSSVAGIEARQFVSGTGVPANTRVVYVDPLTNTVTLSAAFTVQASGTYTFRPWGYTGTYSISPSQTVASTTISGTENTKITVARSGVYNIQFSAQFTNTDTQIHDVDVWFSQNGVDIPASNSSLSVQNSHGGVPGHLIAVVNIFVEMSANDYVEILWRSNSSSVFIEHVDPQTNPIRPAIPSVIVTVNFVSSLPQ